MKMHSRLLTALCLVSLVCHVAVAQRGATEKNDRALAEADRITRAVDNGSILFACDQMDVRKFVQMVGGNTGRRFVVDDDVKGKITVVSPRISKKDAFPIFVSILQSAGCSVINDGDIYRIVALPKRVLPPAPVVGIDDPIPAEGIITKVFLLKHVSADEIGKAIEAKVPGGKSGSVVAIKETNHVIVTDTVKDIIRIQKLITQIDQPGLARTTEIVSLKFAGAVDLADQINEAMAESETRAQRLQRRLPKVQGSSSISDSGPIVVPSPHSNSLLLVGTPTQIETLKSIIAKMDIDVPTSRGRLNAIFLKYISAEEAAKSLTSLLSRPVTGSKTRVSDDKIAIEASMANNALLVDASPGDFDIVSKLIAQIDLIPEQVHIGVKILEHSLSDDLTFGVEMVALDMPDGKGSTVIQGSSLFKEGGDSLMNAIQTGIFPRGITVGVAYGSKTDANGNIVPSYPAAISLDALKKTGNVHIRSETSLETQNNREASVSIVNEIPILKSTIQGGSGTARDVIQNIERLDVGIKLSLIPHIIPAGDVQMILKTSIEAVIDPGPSGSFTPTIAKREVKTTVTVPDGKTIIIAGLTREDKTKIVKKVPILGSIPLIGLLFRHSVDTTEKTNLLILVTPNIVTDSASSTKVTKEWHEKTNLKE